MATTTEPRDPQGRMHAAGSSGSAGSPGLGEAARGDAIGAYLVRQRELRGISLQELADLTRIPLRSLERLESGQFDHDVDGFVRGFVRTVSTALGLDADDTVARMLDEPVGPSDFSRSSSLAISRIAALVGVMAVLMLIVLAGRALIRTGIESSALPATERSYRIDAVRALADASTAELRHRPPPNVANPEALPADPDAIGDLATGPQALPGQP